MLLQTVIEVGKAERETVRDSGMFPVCSKSVLREFRTSSHSFQSLDLCAMLHDPILIEYELQEMTANASPQRCCDMTIITWRGWGGGAAVGGGGGGNPITDAIGHPDKASRALSLMVGFLSTNASVIEVPVTE